MARINSNEQENEGDLELFGNHHQRLRRDDFDEVNEVNWEHDHLKPVVVASIHSESPLVLPDRQDLNTTSTTRGRIQTRGISSPARLYHLEDADSFDLERCDPEKENLLPEAGEEEDTKREENDSIPTICDNRTNFFHQSFLRSIRNRGSNISTNTYSKILKMVALTTLSFSLLFIALHSPVGLLPKWMMGLIGSRGCHGMMGANAQGNGYKLGLGIGDITGPVVETNMMGYASLDQTDTGLHMRQRSRAFIVADGTDDSNRVLFLNLDNAMGDTGIRRGILQGLDSIYPGVYTESNVAVVGTHQHSGVGGYLQDLLPQLTSLGFVKETYDAIVNGAIKSVKMAHENLAPGSLSLGNVTLDSNINRSPYAYEANPADERARYEHDQDKDFHLLKFDDSDGKARGFLSFYAVHGTSIYENNTLVSGDNKGMAAYLYESYAEADSQPGNNTFVAGFTQSNVGDTSPNTLGAFCESPGKPWDGQPCEYKKSTCGNATEDCHGRGPDFTADAFGFGSNRVIGTNQFNAAKELMEGNQLTSVTGGLKSLHTYVDMSNYTFTLSNGTSVHTCPPAMGYSFAGGTTDGPGAFDFVQGDNSSQSQNPFWELVKNAVTPSPSDEQKACQYPKPILLNTGYANTPYQWSPHIVDIQMFRMGQLVMLIMPGEFTTMSGRRIREAVRAKLISEGILGDEAYVVLAGPANTYSHYVATREEYGIQRYEGASTIYGPSTLEAYIDLYTSLINFLASNSTSSPDPGPTPPNLIEKAISLRTGVVQDNPPSGKKFGDVLTDVGNNTYHAGESVSALFVGANPRNNLRLEGTFMTVEQNVDNDWKVVRTDSQPSTTYQWKRTEGITGQSEVNLTWTIEDETPGGSYRFQYFGDSKALLGGKISSFTGTSGTFVVA